MKLTNARCGWFIAAAMSLAFNSATAATIYDDFKSKWRSLERGSGMDLELVRNRVEITLGADAQNENTNYFVRGLFSTCSVHGDFDLRTSFKLLQWPSANGARVAVYLGSITDIRNRGVYLERDSYSEVEGGPFELYVFYADEGQTFIENQHDDTSGRLRLQRIGSIVTGYYWSHLEGIWIEMGSSDVGTEDLPFALIVYSHNSVFADSAVRAAFKSVTLTQGTLTGEACQIATR